MHRRSLPHSRVVALGVFLFLAVVNLTPITWGVFTSLKLPQDILTYPPKLWSLTLTLEHYERLFRSGFLEAMRNSGLYALVTVVVGLALAAVTAYGFDRFDFRFKQPLFMLIVASIPLSIGSAALLIPNYLYFTYWGVTNHWYTLPLIYTAYNLPMAIWILKGSIESTPKELDDAAAIDGCTPMMVLFRIILPLCKPALGAAGMFLFIGSWNEFVAGSVMVDQPSLLPVQVAIYQYIGYFGREWGPLTASATIAILPIIVVFSFFGRLLVSGLSQGSVKG